MTSSNARFGSRASRMLGTTCLTQGIGLAAILLTLSAAGPRAANASPFDGLDIGAVDAPPAGSLPLLAGEAGETAIAGRILATDGTPLSGVLVVDGPVRTVTDASGRFLLEDVASGRSVMILDGRRAVAGSEKQLSDFGYYEVQVAATAGRTTRLPFTDWLPRIDHMHDVVLSMPTASPAVVNNPAIPGLELHIPPGSVITDPDGKPVTRVGITPVPVHRPPYPLPANVSVPTYYTIQPGGSVLSSVDGTWLGAQLLYPNFYNDMPGARASFWRYSPDERGWSRYGTGSVTADGRHIQPDNMTRIYAFSSAMTECGGPPPPPKRPAPPPKLPNVIEGGSGPTPPCASPAGTQCPPKKGDPIDLDTGLVTLTHTDLYVNDVIPIAVTRTYMGADANSYSFGMGTTLDYDMHLYSNDENDSAVVSLVFPNGSSITYNKITNVFDPSSGYTYSTQTPGDFYQSYLTYQASPPGWVITRHDGVQLFFGSSAPLQSITDRFGNKVSIFRANGYTGSITQVASPNGRYIAFTSSSTSGSIVSATDNLGRGVQYAYNPSHPLLNTITDSNGGTASLSFAQTADGGYDLSTISDPRHSSTGTAFVENIFPSSISGSSYLAHQVTEQGVLADSTYQTTNNCGLGSTVLCYQFSYPTVESGSETDVTDPNGHVEKITFDSNGYEILDKRATDSSTYEVDTTLTRNSNELVTDYIESSLLVDGVPRDTHYTYDAFGNVLSITQLYGTADAATWQYTYSPSYGRLISVEDPLLNTTTFSRPEPLEEVTLITDALSNKTTLSNYNALGQVGQITDPMSLTTGFAYDHGDLATVTDPLGHTTSVFTDAIGRPIDTTDALGNSWLTAWDPINGISEITDPLQNLTKKYYDADGNIASLVDANSNESGWHYTALDDLLTWHDGLNYQEEYNTYDGNRNLLKSTDRNGNPVTYTYDPLNRIQTATYTDGSVVTYTWDAGNRLTEIADTAGNTVTQTFNGLDEVLNERSSISGSYVTVAHTYDIMGKPKTSQAGSQLKVAYYYDDDNRLHEIETAANTITLSYDNDSRYLSIALPNNYTKTFNYGTSPLLQSIGWAYGTSDSGTLSYTYDADNRVTGKSLSYTPSTGNPFSTMFQSYQPTTVSGAVYDADNRLCAWNTTSGSCSSPAITYDNNGNLLNDGTDRYDWDSRNRLTAITKETSNYAYFTYVYDALGRRLSLTPGGGTTTTYIYDHNNLVQKQQNGTDYEDELTGLSIDQTFLQMPASGGQLTLVTDALGTVLQTMNTSGASGSVYGYEPYGNTHQSGSTTTNTFQFTGRENDSTLYYYRARYYNPTWGRFISQDPMRFAAGVNFYAYVGGNPIGRLDPFGLSWQSSTVCFIEGVGIGAGGALVVGGAAVAAAALGAPVALVTAALGVAALAGGIDLGANIGADISGGNWDALAFDAGSLLGGAAVGGSEGGSIAEGINGVPSPPWSLQSDLAQGYDSSLGSIGDWLGTGPNPGSAGLGAAAAGAGLAGTPPLRPTPKSCG